MLLLVLPFPPKFSRRPPAMFIVENPVLIRRTLLANRIVCIDTKGWFVIVYDVTWVVYTAYKWSIKRG